MIELHDVHKQLGEFAVRGVSLTIQEREYFVVLGPTGAGKTVLLECIAGLHKLDAGRISINGQDVTALPPEARRVSYVPQDYVLFPHLTVFDNIAFSLRLQRWPQEEIEGRVRELAEMLGISHLLQRRPRTLSGGEQQRTAIARALAPRPTALLLDEPLSALDENTRVQIADELRTLPERFGTTVVHVCHNFDEALQLATRIGVMHQGHIVQVGPPEQVFERPNCRFVAEFMRVRNILAVSEVHQRDGQLVCRLDHDLELVAAPQPVPSPPLLASIRPERLWLSAERPEGAANAFKATVRAVRPLGDVVDVELAAGDVILHAAVTRQLADAASVAPGRVLWASVGPRHVHLFADRELAGEDGDDG